MAWTPCVLRRGPESRVRPRDWSAGGLGETACDSASRKTFTPEAQESRAPRLARSCPVLRCRAKAQKHEGEVLRTRSAPGSTVVVGAPGSHGAALPLPALSSSALPGLFERGKGEERRGARGPACHSAPLTLEVTQDLVLARPAPRLLRQRRWSPTQCGRKKEQVGGWGDMSQAISLAF